VGEFKKRRAVPSTQDGGTAEYVSMQIPTIFESKTISIVD
jgi:hypothetical protein